VDAPGQLLVELEDLSDRAVLLARGMRASVLEFQAVQAAVARAHGEALDEPKDLDSVNVAAIRPSRVFDRGQPSSRFPGFGLAGEGFAEFCDRRSVACAFGDGGECVFGDLADKAV
jgi:hypothetical protein